MSKKRFENGQMKKIEIRSNLTKKCSHIFLNIHSILNMEFISLKTITKKNPKPEIARKSRCSVASQISLTEYTNYIINNRTYQI